MVDKLDMHKINLKQSSWVASQQHVQMGVPIPKSVRVKNFSPIEWESFIEEWATTLNDQYKKVRRFGGSGDKGVDIAGFYSENGFKGKWDNYQCKHYHHALYPSDVWLEIGKIIFYSYKEEYSVPQKSYFIGVRGVGTTLEQLFNNFEKLKIETKKNWTQYCQNRITSTSEILLDGELLDYFEHFNFSIFTSKSVIELIDTHSHTPYHVLRFGGGLPLRPSPENPPIEPTKEESRYIRQLLDAYGDHHKISFHYIHELDKHANLKTDFFRQRERFYSAESLRNFARDSVPAGTFDELQEEIYHGIIDICEIEYDTGFNRMKATLSHSAKIITSNPLTSAIKVQDKQGICHQLANENRINWVLKDD